MKKHLFKLFAFLLLSLAVVSPILAANFPDVIPLPNGFQPEGIVFGDGHTAYAGSLANGDIYAVDVRTGAGEIVINGPGTPAVGLSFDRRTGHLFVSGGPNGDGRVYDTHTGDLITSYDFGGGFVNDVIVTQDAAYFTDSFAPVLYKVALSKNGALASSSTTIALTGDFVFVDGQFNSNGIVASPSGDTLIVAHFSRGELYKVNPYTGESALIDHGSVNIFSADGLVLGGHTIYVVQTFANQIVEFQLNSDYSTATLVEIITDSDFDTATTADKFGNFLYAVNARFTTPAGPDVTYDMVRVQR